MKSVKKERVIVDTHVLNKVIETNTYSMSLQFDITLLIVDCELIFIVNTTAFLY